MRTPLRGPAQGTPHRASRACGAVRCSVPAHPGHAPKLGYMRRPDLSQWRTARKKMGERPARSRAARKRRVGGPHGPRRSGVERAAPTSERRVPAARAGRPAPCRRTRAGRAAGGRAPSRARGAGLRATGAAGRWSRRARRADCARVNRPGRSRCARRGRADVDLGGGRVDLWWASAQSAAWCVPPWRRSGCGRRARSGRWRTTRCAGAICAIWCFESPRRRRRSRGARARLHRLGAGPRTVRAGRDRRGARVRPGVLALALVSELVSWRARLFARLLAGLGTRPPLLLAGQLRDDDRGRHPALSLPCR